MEKLQDLVNKTLDNAIDRLCCDLHNEGASLLGNTQESDLDWFARLLFEASRLGAGSIETVPWLLGKKEWEALKLKPQALMIEGPQRFEHLSDDEAEAWRKLARIVMYVLPQFTDRVGARWMRQSKMLREAWKTAGE